jgi:hypothetical protein
MFIEYLYFTGRIPSYTDYDKVTPEDFEDYLLLEGLNNPLKANFDDGYFNTFYDEAVVSNGRRFMSASNIKLEPDDLTNMANLLAYKLSEAASYQGTIQPQVGAQEHIHAVNLGVRSKKNKVDLSTTIISDSKKAVPGMTVASIKNLIYFLLYSGLACVELTSIGEDVKLPDIGGVMDTLQNSEKVAELEDLFDEISICMTSPLFYTRLGREIFEARGIDPGILRKGMIFGKMLELYVRGGLAMSSEATILTSKKLKYYDADGSEIGEVDISDTKRFLLCELGTDNKKDSDLNLNKYYGDIPFIRIASSRTIDRFNGRYHRIPYAKLCCMIDTGDVFALEMTGASDNKKEQPNHADT